MGFDPTIRSSINCSYNLRLSLSISKNSFAKLSGSLVVRFQVSCSSNSVCRLIKPIEEINSINFWWFSLRLSLYSCFWFSIIVIALMIPSLKSFSINGWESINDTTYFLNSDKCKVWWPSKHLCKWWPSYLFNGMASINKSFFESLIQTTIISDFSQYLKGCECNM